jgi:hypothetical protein
VVEDDLKINKLIDNRTTTTPLKHHDVVLHHSSGWQQHEKTNICNSQTYLATNDSSATLFSILSSRIGQSKHWRRIRFSY